MSVFTEQSITCLLKAWRDGDDHAGNRVISLVYSELKKVAQGYLRREREMTLQTTELVNEAVLRLVQEPNELVFQSRVHFYGIIAKGMRRILVEQVRKKSAKKRLGGRYQVTLDGATERGEGKPLDILRLDEALQELEDFSPRKARLVEFRFFAGLSIEETAATMDVSPSTIKREWKLAKAWLYNRLKR